MSYLAHWIAVLKDDKRRYRVRRGRSRLGGRDGRRGLNHRSKDTQYHDATEYPGKAAGEHTISGEPRHYWQVHQSAYQ